MGSTQRWNSVAVDPLVSMLTCANYSHATQQRIRKLLFTHIVPNLGPDPGQYSTPAISFMCDDGTPIEYSWVVTRDGRTIVRFAIEPSIVAPGGGGTANQAPQVLIQAMVQDGTVANLDWSWYKVCMGTLALQQSHPAWNNVVADMHKTQYFIGYDIDASSGEVSLKAYFIPQLLSRATGIPTLTLVEQTCQHLGLSVPWATLKAFIDSFKEARMRPDTPITAIDFVPGTANRFKVYVRAKPEQMTWNDLVHFFTLGGRLSEVPAVKAALDAAWKLWCVLFNHAGLSQAQFASIRPPPMHGSNRATAALCMYYDLRQGSPLPSPKVYIPVRHYMRSDLEISQAMVQFSRAEANAAGVKRYGDDFMQCFGHLNPAGRVGIHTYVSVAVKKNDYECSAYYSPSAFSPSRSPY